MLLKASWADRLQARKVALATAAALLLTTVFFLGGNSSSSQFLSFFRPLASDREEESTFCSVKNPCIYDIGLNRGQDTAKYLEQGYRVVAVEASPFMAVHGFSRFLDAILAGQLHILNVGIGDAASANTHPIPFYVHRHVSEWSSFAQEIGCRNLDQSRSTSSANCFSVSVRRTTCAALLRSLGVPVYLKIDIEGADLQCLESLFDIDRTARPRFVSVEFSNLTATVPLMEALGYNALKLVDQAMLNAGVQPGSDQFGGSGPWGEDAVDVIADREWRRPADIVARYDPKPGVWYDIHGKLEGE